MLSTDSGQMQAGRGASLSSGHRAGSPDVSKHAKAADPAMLADCGKSQVVTFSDGTFDEADWEPAATMVAGEGIEPTNCLRVKQMPYLAWPTGCIWYT